MLSPSEKKPSVGEALQPLDAGRIARSTLAFFGPASGDYHPIHLDIDVARSAGCDDVFAHGMLSMAYLARVLTNWVDQRQIRTLRGRFTAVTPIFGRPICSAVVTQISESSDGEQIATLELTTQLEDGTQTIFGSATVAI
ncbi:MaoC/PaaZ C-terminal domain-containing protein [Mycolicibacterium fortuitum]|uniref:MaoC/PaaZ C-terminal domain-containing protein n=1 Tax=Mycolicibacterium fortuitum TaxID=1766 RepID=UPI0014902A8E|nr:dehydratase [Mycolicibacterium fortuitum]